MSDIVGIIRREVAAQGGFVYWAQLSSGEKKYFRWENLTNRVQDDYLKSHPKALEEEKRARFLPAAHLKFRQSRKRRNRSKKKRKRVRNDPHRKRLYVFAMLSLGVPSRSLCRSRSHIRSRKVDTAARAAASARQQWPVPVSEARAQRSVAGWRDDMSFPAVREHCCLVCGCKHFEADIEKVPRTNKELLTVISKLLSSAADWFPGIEQTLVSELQGLPVDPAGLLDDGTLSVCKDCYGSLQRSKLPARALANWLWTGPVPPDLQGLTIPEKMLIAAIRVKIYILKLKAPVGPGTEQRGMKGQSIAFPQNTPAIFASLPAPLSTLPDALKVSFLLVPS
jgi:hypothetical protein